MFRGLVKTPGAPAVRFLWAGGRDRVAPHALGVLLSLAAIGLPVGRSVAVAVPPEPSGALPAGARSSPGSGLSYWGTIPPPSDSVTAAFTQPPRPHWATALLVPYRLVALPFTLLTAGSKATVVYLDEHGIVYRIRRLIGPQEGPFGLALRFRAGGLSGFGGGLTATHEAWFARGNRLKVRWHSTVRGSHSATLGMHLRRDRPTSYVLGVGYRLRPNARYFDIGPAAADSLESFYTQEVGWAGLTVRRAIGSRFETNLTALYSAVGTHGPGVKGDRPIAASADVVGYGERSDGLTLSLSLVHNSTWQEGRPGRGGIQRLKVSRFLASDSGRDDGSVAYTDFWTFRAGLERFLRLWFPGRVLALRAYLTWIEPDVELRLPFQRMLTNDDPDLLRGYRDFRWRDRGLAVLSAEYRWPLWAQSTADGLGADVYLLTDLGQVFGQFGEIKADHLTVSYGGGVRLIGNRGFNGRLEVAWSDEETVVRLRTDQIFQFAKAGLLHGRDQVALR